MVCLFSFRNFGFSFLKVTILMPVTHTFIKTVILCLKNDQDITVLKNINLGTLNIAGSLLATAVRTGVGINSQSAPVKPKILRYRII